MTTADPGWQRCPPVRTRKVCGCTVERLEPAPNLTVGDGATVPQLQGPVEMTTLCHGHRMQDYAERARESLNRFLAGCDPQEFQC